MAQYRKKPIVIEAFRWTGGPDQAEDPVWIVDAMGAGDVTFASDGEEVFMFIRTLEGEMTASSGDWIIQGVKGEIYPCKPDIFEATYEPASLVFVVPPLTAEQIEDFKASGPGPVLYVPDEPAEAPLSDEEVAKRLLVGLGALQGELPPSAKEALLESGILDLAATAVVRMARSAPKPPLANIGGKAS